MVTRLVVPELESGAVWRREVSLLCVGKQVEVGVGCQPRLPLDHGGNNMVNQTERGRDGLVYVFVVCFLWREIDPGLYAKGYRGITCECGGCESERHFFVFSLTSSYSAWVVRQRRGCRDSAFGW